MRDRGDGLRNSRTTGGNTTTFTWDVNRSLPVVLDDGNQYVYGAGLASMVTATGTYYYLADGLGSTMAIVDTSGTVQKSYTYDVYGTPTASGTLANEFDFAGQQTDPTGLQYLRARYMDPETGRFLSRDPLAAGQRWEQHPFTYAASSPTGSADPSGLVCVFGVCVDKDGVSAGGHELWEGMKAAAGSVRDCVTSETCRSAVSALAAVTVAAGAFVSLLGAPEVGLPMILAGSMLALAADGASCGANPSVKPCTFMALDFVSVALFKVSLATELKWLQDPLTSLSEALAAILSLNADQQSHEGSSTTGESPCRTPVYEMWPQ